MSKCPQVEIQKLEERLEVAAYVATDRQVYIAELEAENAQLQAENDKLEADVDRLLENNVKLEQTNRGLVEWAHSYNANLQAENVRLRHILYIEGWSDAGIDNHIKEVEK